MLDLKKLLAIGALCTGGVMACDVEEDAEGDGGPSCTIGDATVDPICVTDDAGVETCDCPTGDMGVGGAGGAPDPGGAPVGGVPEQPAPVANSEWSADNKTLTLTITEHADLGPYKFGLAETGNGGGDGWDGEDCIEGVEDDYDICHPVPDNGTLALNSIHPDVEGAGIDALEEGSTTLMNGLLKAGITYVLIRDTDDPNCWTWGHNPQHYITELGCNPLPPAM